MLSGVCDHPGAPGAENEEDLGVRCTDVKDEDMSHNVHDRVDAERLLSPEVNNSCLIQMCSLPVFRKWSADNSLPPNERFSTCNVWMISSS